MKSYPRVTITDKETAKILRGNHHGYHQSYNFRPQTYRLTVTPEIINDTQVKLEIELTVYNNINNTQQSKTITKIVDNEEFMLLDGLSIPSPDKKDHQILFFISPTIRNNQAFTQSTQ